MKRLRGWRDSPLQRFEQYAEAEDGEGRAEEEADGTDEDDKPSVEESRALAGHLNSGRDIWGVDRGDACCWGSAAAKGRQWWEAIYTLCAG